MLHAISWQQYWTALIFLTAAWYTYVGLTYYRPELRALLRLQPAGPMPAVAAAPLHTVIGGIQTDTGSADSDELIFGSVDPDDISDATLPKGPSDELLAEAGTLVSAFAGGGAKADFLSLLQVLLDKYELYREEINLTIFAAILKSKAKKLPFKLSKNELDLHWPAQN